MKGGWLQRLPIARKLRLLITTACATVIVVFCTAFVGFEWVSARQELVRNISVRAQMFATNATAALAFQNATDATEVLEALRADPEAVTAVVFNRAGESFASYSRTGTPGRLELQPVTEVAHAFAGGDLIVWAPITQGTQRLGTLVLRHSLLSLAARLRLFAGISVGFLAGSVLIGFVISSRLQRLISAPILALAGTARAVTRTKNYTVRAERTGEDEIGTLTEDFNAMLAQIEERETALSESQNRLNAIIDSSLDGIITITPAGAVVDINAAAQAKLALTQQAAAGRDSVELLVPPAQKDTHPLSRLVQQPPPADLFGRRLEAQVLRADRTEIPVELALAKIVHSGSRQYVIFLRNIADRKRAESEQRRAADRLMALNRLDRIISSNLDLGQVFAAFAREMSAFVSFDRTAFVALQEAGEWVVVHSWARGENEPADRPESRGALAHSGLAWVAQQKRPLVEHEINQSWAEADLLQREGLRSRALFPLVVNDRTVGVLAVTSRRAAAFDRDAVDFLQALADQLALAVQNADLFEAVRRQAAELERRVGERTLELVNANKELEAFSYSVSHDLRSPLRAVAGFTRILMDDHAAGLPPDVARYLGLIQSNAQKMGQLIDDLLTFSRLSKQPLKKAPFDLARISHDAYHSLESERAGKAVQFHVGELPPVVGDPVLLRQVLVNLISNALKYSRTRDPAVVEIGAQAAVDETGPVFYVRDNGVGFDMTYAAKLFGVFQRLHPADEFEGTGVGLAIVQRIIHRHGGRVWAEAAPEAGATFFFTLHGETNHE